MTTVGGFAQIRLDVQDRFMDAVSRFASTLDEKRSKEIIALAQQRDSTGARIYSMENFPVFYQQAYDLVYGDMEPETGAGYWQLGIWKPSIQKIVERSQAGEVEYKGASTGVMCRSCGGTNISEQGAQTRAADEGQTIFRTCQNCGTEVRIG